MSESNCIDPKLIRLLLLDDGMQRSVDESISALEAVKIVLEIHPNANKLALCALANTLTKPAKSPEKT